MPRLRAEATTKPQPELREHKRLDSDHDDRHHQGNTQQPESNPIARFVDELIDAGWKRQDAERAYVDELAQVDDRG